MLFRINIIRKKYDLILFHKDRKHYVQYYSAKYPPKSFLLLSPCMSEGTPAEEKNFIRT